jgi:hypothetical protein
MSDRYAELEQQTLTDDEDEAETKLPRTRMPHLRDRFVRVKEAWIEDRSLFTAKGRLFLQLLHESRWGQREVRVTATGAAKIGITHRHQSRYVRELERDGRVSVDRTWPRTLTVTVLVE